MKWWVAVSFSGPDLKLAEAVALALNGIGIGTYCYTSHIGEQVGSPLYLLHEQIFGDAQFVVYFLRRDFLERPFTSLEYEVGLARQNAIRRSIFISIENDANFLIPRGAPYVIQFKSSDFHFMLTHCASSIENIVHVDETGL